MVSQRFIMNMGLDGRRLCLLISISPDDRMIQMGSWMVE